MPRKTAKREFSIGELASQNPWWSDPSSIDSDVNIQSFNSSRVPWIPRLKYKFEWTTDLVYTLRGPRQVGKTTLLKLMIKDLVKQIPPDHVLYFNCENLDTRSELVALIQTYVDWIRRRSRKRVFLFIDETTAVDQWQRAIKFLVDSGKLRATSCVLTGSHSMDIKTCAERLPGRRGQSETVLDKLMLPMKFSEYAETLDNRIRDILRENQLFSENNRKSALNSILKGEIPVSLEKVSVMINELNGYLEQYFITGGIAPVLDDFVKTGRVADSRYRDYLNVVLGDLSKLGLRESYVKQIVSRLTETLGTSVSWRTIANTTDIPHHETVAQYVECLKENFTLAYIYYLDIRKKGPAFEKQKKIHFHDPFIFHTLRTWVEGGAPFQKTLEYLKDAENTGRLAECVACSHAIRLAFLLSRQKHTFDPTSSLFYWRTNDKEIDLVVRINDHFLPVEVKYQRHIDSADLFAISKFRSISESPVGLILSKDQSKVNRNAIILPMSLLLLLV
mgnify:CR=1 FL=1